MARKYRICYLWSIVLLILFCTGCQKTPETDAVKSKNDNSFDVNSIATAPETHPQEEILDIAYNAEFTSSDGSVHFQMDINQALAPRNMPIVRVSSHFLTAEDAKRVAFTLFPDATFYEAEPSSSMNFSKSEIQKKIQRWSQYTTEEAMQSLYGGNARWGDTSVVKDFIERYTELYESAPEDNPHSICQWTMRKTSEYLLPKEELSSADTSGDNDEISAQFNVDGIPYYFTAATRNRSDFKVNMISLVIEDGASPYNIDSRIFDSLLCKKEEPTEEQIVSVKSKAEQWLNQFGLGEWMVDEAYVSHGFDEMEDEYVICVNATPMLNQVPALRRPQLASLRDPNGYSPGQYYTEANFKFAPGGELMSFTLFTPLDIQEIVNENAAVMDTTDLLDRAKELLALSDAYEYGFGGYLDAIEEDVKCSVTISDMEYGLSRVRVPDQDDSYYYIPSIILKGMSEYVGMESGTTYYFSEVPMVLIILNAADGSVINATNE